MPMVAETANEIRPLINGERVPSTMVLTSKGKSVDLSKELLGKKTVLVFYRGGWCPYCNLQLQGLRKIEKKLKKNGWQIVGISPDSIESMSDSVKKNKLSYTVYSDRKINAARNFGLAFQVSESTNTMLLGYGIDIVKASGETHKVLPVPAVYLINDSAEVVFNYVHPNYKVRLKESIILEAAKELK
jgi:peroxiredoxin